MKQLLFIIVMGLSQFCFGQISNDSVKSVIPLIDLKFTAGNYSSSEILASASKQIATTVENDSIYVYQYNYENVFMIVGNDSTYSRTDLKISSDTKYNYHFSFDSLGTDQTYLVIKWYGRNYNERDSYSGNGELLCNQTIDEYKSIESGLTIVSLMSRKILFQGLSEVREIVCQTTYPGGKQREIKNERITKARLLQNNFYLNLFNHGYVDFNYWMRYDDLPFGFYHIVNDQYVLIRKT